MISFIMSLEKIVSPISLVFKKEKIALAVIFSFLFGVSIGLLTKATRII